MLCHITLYYIIAYAIILCYIVLCYIILDPEAFSKKQQGSPEEVAVCTDLGKALMAGAPPSGHTTFMSVIYLSIYLSIHLSIYLSIYLSYLLLGSVKRARLTVAAGRPRAHRADRTRTSSRRGGSSRTFHWHPWILA